MSDWHLFPESDIRPHWKVPICPCDPVQHFSTGVWVHNKWSENMERDQLEDALNRAFQEKLYELIDSKANGLKDCTVTEVIDAAFQANNDVLGAQS